MSDFISAINCQAHKNIPFWELEFHLWDKFSSKTFYCGTEFQKLTNLEKEQALYLNSEIIIEVSCTLGFSAVTLPGGYWELSPEEPAYFWLPDDYRFRQAEILKMNCPKEITLVANTGGVLGIPDAANYIDFSLKLLENPEEIDVMAATVFNKGVENVTRFKDIGIDVMLTASDLADNSGPYFSPDQMERFVLPYLSKWSKNIKELGANSILHTDGNIISYFDAFKRTEINALQAIDPVAGMNMIDSLKKANNEICLCGNVDCGLLLTGRPEDVYEQTEFLLESSSAYNGFVLGSSNAVVNEVPKENYLALTEALKSIAKN